MMVTNWLEYYFKKCTLKDIQWKEILRIVFICWVVMLKNIVLKVAEKSRHKWTMKIQRCNDNKSKGIALEIETQS
jgi:hypothetical protein